MILKPRSTRASTGADFLRPKKKSLNPQKTNENRHSFYGYENRPQDSPNLNGRDFNPETGRSVSPLSKQRSETLTDPHSSSTPNRLVNLDTLVEDDGPASPDKRSSKTLDLSVENSRDNSECSAVVELSDSSNNVDNAEINGPKTDVLNAEMEESTTDRDSSQKMDNLSLTEKQTKSSLKVGDVVKVSENLEGQVRFYGRTQFSDGIWVGLALTVPSGKACSGKYLLVEVSNRSARKRCEICLKLTIKTPERQLASFWCLYC